MLISEVEAKLKEMREKHGDLPVKAGVRRNDAPVERFSDDVAVRRVYPVIDEDHIEICGWVD